MKYKINEITPKAYQCAAWACPAIYKGLKEMTPKEMGCTSFACPSINETEREGQKVYLIVGKIVNPADVGLAKKVGEGEALIEVPRGLISGIVK